MTGIGSPDSENDFKSLAGRSRKDVLSGVAFARGICPDNGAGTLQGVEVSCVVTGGLARAIGFFVPYGVTKSACGGDDSRGSGQSSGSNGGETHVERRMRILLKTV